MKTRLVGVVLISAVMLAAAGALACVGKTIQIGVLGGGEGRILSKMLAILVNERTGTSIKIREYPGFRESFAAMEKDEVDVVIAFPGQALTEAGGSPALAESPEKVMETARQTFNEKFNLVWLEPWGVSDEGRFIRDPAGRPVTTLAAPLVRKDTLKEFPALARLINKMAGRLPTTVMAGLLKKAETGDPDRIVREYLKAEKLI
jgi:osmoprotectant transport system substrate-binding protein